MAQNGNTQWGQVLLFVIHYFFYLVTIKLAEMEVRAVTHFGAISCYIPRQHTFGQKRFRVAGLNRKVRISRTWSSVKNVFR